MKVLNVTTILDPVFGGGTAERTFQMSKAITKSGSECIILTTDVGLTKARIDSLEGIKVVALHCMFKRFFIVRFSWSNLNKLISGVDVIHLMGHWSMLNILVFLIAKKTGTPFVICPAGELSLFGRSRWIKKIFNFFFGCRIVKAAKGHIAITKDEISVYKTYGIKEELVTVIPNGVNETDFYKDERVTFSRKFGLGNNPFILFMGRLNPIKGPDLLLEAFCLVAKDFPEYHLVFAGPDGGLLESLQFKTKEKKLENRIHFVGYLSGVDKTNSYHEASFLIIPSRLEAMSIVVLEAGISGTPVLLTDQCGFNEVEAITGGLVVHATVNDLQAGLIKMMNKKSNLKVMGSNLKEFVIEQYTWNMICQRLLKMYDQIILNKQAPTCQS